MKSIYLDYAATTPLDERVLSAMLPYLKDHYGNPSSVHSFGRKAKDALEQARRTLASLINAHPSEIVFTGSGSESDNLAILGYALSHQYKGKHLITAVTEHNAVLNTCRYLEEMGFEVTYLPVDSRGRISLEDLKAAIRKDTLLISIMMVNNELGNIYPIREIAQIAHERGVVVHTDAVQAFGKMEINIEQLGIDLLSMAAHKIYGPKGVGALYVRRGIRIEKILFGGHQERDRRPGTENVAGIVGFAEAARICYEELELESRRIGELRDYFEHRVLTEIPDVQINGDPGNRLFPFSNLSFRNVQGESLLLALDIRGVAVSSGSACSSGAVEPSHVLRAIATDDELANTSLRFSFGRFTTREDIDHVVNEIKPLVERIRKLGAY